MAGFVMDERIKKEAAEIGITPELMLAHMMAMQLDMLELGALLVKIGQDHEEVLNEWSKQGPTCELDVIIHKNSTHDLSDMQRLGRVMMANHQRHVAHPDYNRRSEELRKEIEAVETLN